MAVSYAASHPDLPGDGITPKSGPDSARPSFEGASGSTPSLSPYEASQAQRASDGNAPTIKPVQLSDSELSKPRDPMPRLEPHPNVVKQVHAGLMRVRQFAPKTQSTPANAPLQARPVRPVTIGPQSLQERDLGAAMAAYRRMDSMTNHGMREDFGRHRGRGVSG